MKHSVFLMILAIPALPSATFAFDLGGGLTGTGRVELEYNDSFGDSTIATADLAMSWRSGAVLGFDAALETIYFDKLGDDFTNLWGAVVLTTSFGEIAIGAPRPVTETMRVLPEFSSSREFDLEASLVLGPYITSFSFGNNGITPGLAFTASAGDLSYGLSYHQIKDGGDRFDFYEGAMNYVSGQTTYFITAEVLDSNVSDGTSVTIGALHTADRLAFGGSVGQSDFVGPNITTVRLMASYDVLPALTITGDYLNIESLDEVFALSAEYRFGQIGFVQAGVTSLRGDESYDIGVGVKF